MLGTKYRITDCLAGWPAEVCECLDEKSRRVLHACNSDMITVYFLLRGVSFSNGPRDRSHCSASSWDGSILTRHSPMNIRPFPGYSTRPRPVTVLMPSRLLDWRRRSRSTSSLHCSCSETNSKQLAAKSNLAASPHPHALQRFHCLNLCITVAPEKCADFDFENSLSSQLLTVDRNNG